MIVAGLCVAFGLIASSGQAQSRGTVSALFTVTVTVVRPCGITTAPAASAASAPAAHIRLSCGQLPSTASVSSGTLVPVAGISAPAAVSTSTTPGGLVLSVNF